MLKKKSDKKKQGGEKKPEKNLKSIIEELMKRLKEILKLVGKDNFRSYIIRMRVRHLRGKG